MSTAATRFRSFLGVKLASPQGNTPSTQVSLERSKLMSFADPKVYFLARPLASVALRGLKMLKVGCRDGKVKWVSRPRCFINYTIGLDRGKSLLD